MTYIGEYLNTKLLGNLNRAMIALAALFAVAVATLGVLAFAERGKVASMKEEIANKSKAIVDFQAAAKEEKGKPATEKIPKGLAAIGLFQTKLNRLAAQKGCALAQFQASDQMNPFISTFSTTAPAAGNWTQVEVKMNLVGTTRSVVETLKDLSSLNIPYEFTSVEMSRTQASANGEATVNANISLRVLTIPGGA